MISPKILVIIGAILMMLIVGFYKAGKENYDDTLCYIAFILAIPLGAVVLGLFATAF